MGAYLYGEQRESLYAPDGTHQLRSFNHASRRADIRRWCIVFVNRAHASSYSSLRRDSAVLEARRWLPLGIPRVSRASDGIAMRHSDPEVSQRETDDKSREVSWKTLQSRNMFNEVSTLSYFSRFVFIVRFIADAVKTLLFITEMLEISRRKISRL